MTKNILDFDEFILNEGLIVSYPADKVVRYIQKKYNLDDDSVELHIDDGEYILVSKKLDKNMFEEIVRLRTKKISNFDLDRKLIEANNNFITLKEKYKELQENEKIIEISKKIDELDETLIVNRNYYNKNIAEYNKLVKLFPTNIVAKLCKYEEKLFFDRKDMSDDDFNDFKL